MKHRIAKQWRGELILRSETGEEKVFEIEQISTLRSMIIDMAIVKANGELKSPVRCVSVRFRFMEAKKK